MTLEEGAAAAKAAAAAADGAGPGAHGHLEAAAGAEVNGNKKSKADKKKEKRQKYKQNKQQRRQQQAPEGEAAAAAAPAAEGGGGAAAAAGDGDGGDDDELQVVVEYVPAPAPDLEELVAGVAGGGGAGGDDGDGDEPSAAAHEGGAAAAAAEDVAEQFKRVLERFMPQENEGGDGGDGDDAAAAAAAGAAGAAAAAAGGADAADGGGAGPAPHSDGDSDEDGDGDGGAAGGGKGLSKKQRRLLHRLKVAELKQQCARPDVVEVWDVTAPDPQTLVALKGLRNTVPVPRHWSQKRKYLSGKKGVEKPPFRLPDFIEATGITEMRNAYAEKEQAKKLKQKLRDRMSAKTGRMDIAYEVLYDAFFRHQTKPRMTAIGDLYYEGKEYEAKLEHLRPGHVSAELRAALGMDAPDAPPPWLVNMQRYGPPPSYPNLKIPGLNAPIPPGASFGFQPGGWGKPPVDAAGNAVYGDVFGLQGADGDSDDGVDKAARWGEVDDYDEEEEEEEEEEQEEEDEGELERVEGRPGEEADDEAAAAAAAAAGGLVFGDNAALAAGIASGVATGAASLASGLGTPDVGALNLRKAGDGAASAQPPQLYKVLEQRKASVGGGLLGTDHVYVIPGGAESSAAAAASGGGKRRPPGAPPADVEVTLTPEELEGLDEAGVQALYQAKLAAAQAAARGAHGREDFSDLVAGHAAAQKRKLAARSDARQSKKAKDDTFKF